MGLDVGGHLGSQRRRQHLPRPSRTIVSNCDELAAEPLAASRPAPSWTTLSMGVPFRTDAPNAGPDQNFDDFQIILGKVRPSTSPHPPEGHPQVLIIAHVASLQNERPAT
jgi:hypothetical protein